MTKRITIAFVLEATIGGTRRHVNDLLLGLDPGRFSLHAAISLRREPEFTADISALEAAGVDIHVVDMERGSAFWKDRRAIRELRDVFTRIRPDIVHAHGSKGGYLGRLAAARAKVRAVVHTAHVYPFQWVSAGKRLLYRWVEKRCAGHTTRAVMLTRAQQEFITGEGILPPERTIVIPNGVSLGTPHSALKTDLGLPEDALVVGTVGRLVPQKHPQLLIAALADVIKEDRRVHGLIIGRGPKEERVRSLIREHSLEGRVHMAGHREDARELYQTMDIFALPSRYEGLPYALIEAMAAGLPVVTTDWLGAREVVDDTCAVITPLGNADALGAAIKTLAGDADLRARLGAAGRARVEERFSLQRFVDSHAALYETLCRGP